jgi:RNA recognition motif-containing protein
MSTLETKNNNIELETKQAQLSQEDKRAVFVGGLLDSTKSPAIEQYFSQFGQIQEVNLIIDWVTGKSKRCAIVICGDHATCQNILKQKKHFLEGRTIRVDEADQTKKGTKIVKTTKIFLGHVSPDLTEKDLLSFFMKYGKVKWIKVVRKQNGYGMMEPSSNGFLEFVRVRDAQSLLKDRHNVIVNGCKIFCQPFKAKNAQEGRFLKFISNLNSEMLEQALGVYFDMQTNQVSEQEQIYFYSYFEQFVKQGGGRLGEPSEGRCNGWAMDGAYGELKNQGYGGRAGHQQYGQYAQKQGQVWPQQQYNLFGKTGIIEGRMPLRQTNSQTAEPYPIGPGYSTNPYQEQFCYGNGYHSQGHQNQSWASVPQNYAHNNSYNNQAYRASANDRGNWGGPQQLYNSQGGVQRMMGNSAFVDQPRHPYSSNNLGGHYPGHYNQPPRTHSMHNLPHQAPIFQQPRKVSSTVSVSSNHPFPSIGELPAYSTSYGSPVKHNASNDTPTMASYGRNTLTSINGAAESFSPILGQKKATFSNFGQNLNLSLRKLTAEEAVNKKKEGRSYSILDFADLEDSGVNDPLRKFSSSQRQEPFNAIVGQPYLVGSKNEQSFSSEEDKSDLSIDAKRKTHKSSISEEEEQEEEKFLKEIVSVFAKEE